MKIEAISHLAFYNRWKFKLKAGYLFLPSSRQVIISCKIGSLASKWSFYLQKFSWWRSNKQSLLPCWPLPVIMVPLIIRWGIICSKCLVALLWTRSNKLFSDLTSSKSTAKFCNLTGFGVNCHSSQVLF